MYHPRKLVVRWIHRLYRMDMVIHFVETRIEESFNFNYKNLVFTTSRIFTLK